jgi:CRISPR/Cas system-associated endonuclease Cas1
MANVSVDTNVSNIVVSTSQSNITVSDDGVIISNITVLESNINVGTTQNIINVAEVAAVSDADVRAALGNTAPILYNVSTGIFSFDILQIPELIIEYQHQY